MGALTSRQNAAIEEAEIASNHTYKYPPKSGNYFGSHFIMGGERFDTPQPEAYLFGENADLNFLGTRPTPFPYPPPQANEPTKTLKSLVNIRKESVRFVKTTDTATKLHGAGDSTVPKGTLFNIEFIFDSDARCTITIYYFCSEDFGPNGVNYNSKKAELTSETYHYKRGVNQLFSQTMHTFNPSTHSDEDLSYNSDKEYIPIAIHCVVDEDMRQSHTTICVVDHHTDGTYALRALKQKIYVDGLSYLLQEIYGIENKNINKISADDDTEDNGSECVICMCDTRDTLILPCRHLCLCNSCADSLRYQANNCPICRAPFRALLQIRAVQKNSNMNNIINPTIQSPQDGNCDNIPAGYIPVSLIEALNGPPIITTTTASSNTIVAPTTTATTTTPITTAKQQLTNDLNNEMNNENNNDAVQAAEILNRTANKLFRQNSSKDNDKCNKDKTTAEFRMSVLMSKDEHSLVKDSNSMHKNTQMNNRDKINENNNKNNNIRGQRDSVKLVNEKMTLEPEEDSDIENLSPLLDQNKNFPSTALHIDGIEESIDDTDTDVDDEKLKKPVLTGESDSVTLAGAEDSDYYTPEDPHTTILSPLYTDKSNDNGKAIKDNLTVVSTPLAALKENAVSLPDSPISGNSASTRSSGDSYSSSSSTRQLLSSVPVDKIVSPVDANNKLTNDDKNNKQVYENIVSV